jgi:hypothetical protein
VRRGFPYTSSVIPFRRLVVPGIVVALLFALAGPFGCAARKSFAPLGRPPATAPLAPEAAADAWHEAQGVFETRCVVCHGCYDAPCQLKLGTFDGIERGATTDRVYDASRLVAASPTRLDIDAHDVAGWRKKGFHTVLTEGDGSDPRSGVLLRMLGLKRAHPVPDEPDLRKDFTLDLDRKETCTTADRFDDYAKSHPLWGMPYALPGLDPKREQALVRWIEAGAPRVPANALPPELTASIDAWEKFLNRPSTKGELVGRYVYEHLFLASLHFPRLAGVDDRTFFRLVRSRTPPGEPLDEIPTRRPFDDPGTPTVYYRFVQRLERPLEKTMMPYALTEERLRRDEALFFGPKYDVTQLPGYARDVAANPFRAFEAIPAESRYRFMLDEAEFTMMGFIKGPVCRGQVALDVIEDRFWITFIRPDAPWMKEETSFLAGVKQDLDLPAEGGSTALPTLWFGYAKKHADYVAKRNLLIERATKDGEGITENILWDGDGTNANAALTVFRHFDSATVVKGLVGRPTKTAWVVGYPLLERIHYLLVAGFDVFGNVGHQITTRLYMDFLRMEGEADFLMLLPPARRQELVELWYRGVDGSAKETVARELEGFDGAPRIAYRSATPERELFAKIEARLGHVEPHEFDLAGLADGSTRAPLESLARVRGKAASRMPEMSFVTIEETDGARAHVTVLRDSAHTNVAHLFHEDARRLVDEDELTVVRGFLGAYPNALFAVARADLPAFVEAVGALDDDASYARLRARFGVLRASDRFWSFSDAVQEDHRARDGVTAGLFDYNRLDGR